MIDLSSKKDDQIIEEVIKIFQDKGSLAFNLGEIFGYMPGNLDLYRKIISVLKNIGCKFAEDQYGIDILKTNFSATLIEIPIRQEPTKLEPEPEEDNNSKVLKKVKNDLVTSPVAFVGKYIIPPIHGNSIDDEQEPTNKSFLLLPGKMDCLLITRYAHGTIPGIILFMLTRLLK